MPRILRQLPEARLHIIGSKIPESIKSLASDHIVTHGYVEKVDSFFESCLLSVAPLRWGAGVKGKINQSMSFGVPVVATSIGVEGMHLTPGKDILLADTAAKFAGAVVRLHRDPVLWQLLSRESLKNIERYFSIAAARRNVDLLLSALEVPRPEILSPEINP